MKEKRIPQNEQYEFMDEFMIEVKKKWPKVLVQFEDFSTPACFDLLERYRNDYLCFNDDIQGTGAVILSGFMNAVKTVGLPLREHKIIFFGAGSAASGVAEEILDFLVKEENITDEEGLKQFYFVDSKGLITTDRGDKLQSHKQRYARNDNKGVQCHDLLSTIEYVRPSALFGLSVQGGAFTKQVVQRMYFHQKKPIIFPLSNPTSKSECTFHDALEWTEGNVIFASGSPFDPIQHNNKKYIPGQGNNMYIFPGLGVGGYLGRCPKVTDKMIYAASKALAESVTPKQLEDGQVYPPLSQVRAVSASIAAAVIRCWNEEYKEEQQKKDGKIWTPPAEIAALLHDNKALTQYISQWMYNPRYPNEK